MATIVLSSVGAAVGGSIGGSVLGISSAAIGRFAGAVIGRSIDQRLLGQGSDVVETGRVDRLRLTGAGEGDAVAQIYGRMRVSGQVIWATEFREDVSTSGGRRGGKGAPKPPTPKQRNFSYSVSLAIALSEGEITHVGRVWADGSEIAPDSLNMRVYRGTMDQLPDPKMEAVEGAGQVPAYRGTAYVVIEDLDLATFGNRVPQFTFEVTRPSQPFQEGYELDPAHGIRAVALLPGSGEYALATTPVNMNFGFGTGGLANVNSPSAKADFATSLDNLTGEIPGCRGASLVVSWFGDDLRSNVATIRPKLEQNEFDSSNMPWQVSGLTRQSAQLVVRDDDDRPVYGGTPADVSVIEAILALQQSGKDVMYYPFILMEQTANNGLPDPYSDAPDQAVLPWRGRITLSKAPGQPGSTDGTAGADAEVAAFFGTAQASDFTIGPVNPVPDPNAPVNGAIELLSFGGTVKQSPITYTGPDEWGYRRFILHQAALCAAVGGVESFCIGSEMRGLTQIRGAGNSFPAVTALIALAAEVRSLLGPDVKISYAADWSEYFGFQPQDGSGDVFFNLDPLWADSNIDFIGIDNYVPLSDWREGQDHLDADFGAIYKLDYLQSNIEGGEGFEWFYHSHEAREAQIRTPIFDGAYEEHWIFRFKDYHGWWLNSHHERVGGVRAGLPTDWIPQSKPFRFTEFGCAAVDKGTNQPNKFVDLKSSESSLPYFSDGQRDELIQHQYLRAMTGYWNDPAHNPVSIEYDEPMIDMEHAHVWAWDARPYPFFPNNRGLWSDGENYSRGHWITGRASARSLASVVDEINIVAGVEHRDLSHLFGHVRGFVVDQVREARASLQPLQLRYGFDAVERDGILKFELRDGLLDELLDPQFLVRDPELNAVLEETRGAAAETAGRVRLRFIEADGNFEVIAEEAILPDDATHAVSTSEMPLVMTRAEGRQTVERWLSESQVSTDTLRLSLPPSRLQLGAGDIFGLPEDGGTGLFRIDRVEILGNAQRIEAVRIEPESYRPIDISEIPARVRTFTPPTPVTPLFMDLPLMVGDEVPHAPHLAVTAVPWPGTAALYSSDVDANYDLNLIVPAPTPVGLTETVMPHACEGVIDRSDGLIVKMLSGQLESVSDEEFLAGANLCAIGDGTPDGWELFQFRDAQLIGENTYSLSHRLRGQAGTNSANNGAWPIGSIVARMDGTPLQIALAEAKRGLARHYRIGPGARPVDDPSYQHAVLAFDGIGLRPYSPAHLHANAQVSGDINYDWIRRTRIGGDRWDTPEVPLGEETEQYLLRVMQGTTVVREVMVNTPGWTYSAADQATDAISGAFELHVAQMSASFGPGVFAILAQSV